jgi:hypothetical protein
VNKAPESTLTIPADHHAITSLPPEERRDRARVNKAVPRMRESTVINMPRSPKQK